MPRKVLCLDWDRRALRMVVAKLGRGVFSLEDAHSHRIPASLDVDDPKVMGDFIAQMLKRHRWRHHRVIVDVPRDRAVINRLQLAPTPNHELAAAVRFQAMKELPFPLDEAVIDFVVLQRDANRMVTEVLLAAVRIESLDRLRETCSAAGLTPARIGLRPYANLVSVTHLPSAADKRVLFVDVGPTMTEIDVIRGGLLAFSRSANVLVPVREVELVWTEESRISSKSEQAQIEAADRASETAVSDLVVEIVRTLQAFRATEPNAVIDRIVIGGSTGQEPELTGAIERRLGLPTELFDPTGVLRVSVTESVKLRSFSAVLGLAWGLSTDGLLELDFLNPKRPAQAGEDLKRRVRIGGIAAATVLLGAGAAYGAYFHSKTKALDAVKSEITVLTDKIKKQREIENRIAEVDDWRMEAVWLDHLANIVDLFGEPTQQKLIARSLKFDEGGPTITMELYCKDQQTASDFTAALNQVRDEKDRPLYRADQGVWREGSTGDPGFAGTVVVSVRLLDLERFKAGVKDREKERKKRLTTF